MAWRKLSLNFDFDWTGAARNLIDDNQPPYLRVQLTLP
jgi:hypothetical protein